MNNLYINIKNEFESLIQKYLNKLNSTLEVDVEITSNFNSEEKSLNKKQRDYITSSEYGGNNIINYEEIYNIEGNDVLMKIACAGFSEDTESIVRYEQGEYSFLIFIYKEILNKIFGNDNEGISKINKNIKKNE